MTNYYNINFTSFTEVKIINVFKHLTLINNDTNFSIKISIGFDTVYILKPNQSITFLDIFDIDEPINANIILKLFSDSVNPVNIEIINYGMIKK